MLCTGSHDISLAEEEFPRFEEKWRKFIKNES
jgi:hypothetical protein